MMRELKALLDEVPAEVERTISPNEVMNRRGPPDAYFDYGRAALRCIKLALLAAGKEEVRTILDLPCGHGRVLRMLRAAFPTAETTVCDLDRDAVDFCAATFGAVPVYSTENPDDIPLRGAFDLIWCGSLLTHLDQDRWAGFLVKLESVLARDGILVFTTHGRWIARTIRDGIRKFGGISEETSRTMVDTCDRTGFGYANYRQQQRYGISLSSLSWVCSLLQKTTNLRVLCFTERGWRNDQDTIACVQQMGLRSPPA